MNNSGVAVLLENPVGFGQGGLWCIADGPMKIIYMGMDFERYASYICVMYE
jgi:hypothetical protein